MPKDPKQLTKSAWEHCKIRAKRAGGWSPWQDIVVAVLATIIGYIVLDRKSARENAVIALVIGLGAAIAWQSLRFIWRFLWTVPREMEAEHDAAIQKLETTTAKTTMSRDWPGDWRLMEDGFRRQSQSAVRADLQGSSFGANENWRVCGDHQNIVGEVEAFGLQSGRLLIVSPMSNQLSAEVRSQQDDLYRWLYFLKEKYGLNDVQSGVLTVDGKTYAVSTGSINKLALVSARACVECAARTFPR